MSDEMIGWSIKKSEEEIRDLKQFWNEISWWERDKSMDASLEWIETLFLTNQPSDQKDRIQAIQEEVVKLKDANKRPSRIRLFLHLLPYEGPKPIFLECLFLIRQLSNDELISLGKYLGLKDIELLRGRTYDLFELYAQLGENRSLAMFYAIRNYLGRRMRQKG